MLDMDKIHEEIKYLEECGCTSYDVCNKLAILYIIRDHYKGAGAGSGSQIPAPSLNKAI